MIYKINGENPFQVLSDSFSVSPSESGYQLQISADGKNYTNFATVAANTTKQFTGMNNGNFYRLSGNTSDVTINWMRECKSSGGSGGGSGSTVTWNQVVTGGTKIAEISIDGASTNVYAPEGGDSKSLVNFDETSQADRAALYTELKAINDGGSGNTINSNYDFYKTLNNNQGVKFEYYGFDSADTLVLGAVVASGDSSAYEQVVKIQSGGTVQVETNAIGGGGSSKTIVELDSLSQAERADLYAELSAKLSSGETVNEQYEFYNDFHDQHSDNVTPLRMELDHKDDDGHLFFSAYSYNMWNGSEVWILTYRLASDGEVEQGLNPNYSFPGIHGLRILSNSDYLKFDFTTSAFTDDQDSAVIYTGDTCSDAWRFSSNQNKMMAENDVVPLFKFKIVDTGINNRTFGNPIVSFDELATPVVLYDEEGEPHNFGTIFYFDYGYCTVSLYADDEQERFARLTVTKN